MRALIEWISSVWTWLVIVVSTIVFTIPIVITGFLFGPFDRSRKIPHYLGILWAKSIFLFNPMWQMEVHGRKNFNPDKTYVVVSNHASLVDILCIFTLGLQFKWIAKESLFKIPFFGWSMGAMKYIPLERGAHGSIKKSYALAKEWVKRGVSVVLFPEGTRSRTGQLGDFKNGAFKLALEIKAPILPIAIAGTFTALPKGRMKSEKVRMSVTVFPPIKTDGLGPDAYEEIKTEVRSMIAHELSKPAHKSA